MAAPPKKVGREGTKRGGTESSPIRRRSRRHFDPNNETCAMIYEGNYDGYTRPSNVAFQLAWSIPKLTQHRTWQLHLGKLLSLASQQRTRNLVGAGGHAGNFPHSILSSMERKLIAFFAR